MKRVQLWATTFAIVSASAGLSGHATVGTGETVTSATQLVGVLFSAGAEVGIGLGRGGAQIFDSIVSLMAGDWAPGDPPRAPLGPPAAWPALPAATDAPLVPAPPLRK